MIRAASGTAATGAALLLVVTLVLAACADEILSPAATEPPAPGAEPPAALLLVGAGFPVAGQLGTYTWRDVGSASPWLPGARAALPANVPLGFQFDVAVPITRWNVTYVPAGVEGPAGAEILGEGLIRGRVLESDVLPRGVWTVELRVSFGSGLGNATYFWQIAVG